jgi:hypothetical protein
LITPLSNISPAHLITPCFVNATCCYHVDEHIGAMCYVFMRVRVTPAGLPPSFHPHSPLLPPHPLTHHSHPQPSSPPPPPHPSPLITLTYHARARTARRSPVSLRQRLLRFHPHRLLKWGHRP